MTKTIRARNESHPVGSDAAFANIGESCLGEPMVFLPDARGPVAIAKLSPTAPEMLALIEHAKHGAWVARNKARATNSIPMVVHASDNGRFCRRPLTTVRSGLGIDRS
jgi:hypothetical protein